MYPTNRTIFSPFDFKIQHLNYRNRKIPFYQQAVPACVRRLHPLTFCLNETHKIILFFHLYSSGAAA